VSETYTAVYERDGEAWIAEIAEKPGVRTRGANMGEVRNGIRDALARSLGTDPGELHVVDDFRMPSAVRRVRQQVQETRTEDDRAEMMKSMTDSKTMKSWAEDLGIAMRDPVTAALLKRFGDRQVSVDTFCHTITMVEELSRLSAEERGYSVEEILKEH
jgi:hypothetical protein